MPLGKNVVGYSFGLAVCRIFAEKAVNTHVHVNTYIY